MSNSLLTRACWAVVAGFVLTLAQHWALAQDAFPNASGKITGERYWPARATTRHIEAARGYAQDFQRYLTAAGQPEPSVVKALRPSWAGT